MLVAVYGTLKRNFSNHDPYMRGAIFMCNIVVPGIMFSMHHYPGVILHDNVPTTNDALRKFCLNHRAHCEVYSVDDKILKSLDHLEGHPDYYQRLPYRHENLDEVWIYTIKPHVYLTGLQRVVPGGVWNGWNTTIQEVNFGDGTEKPKIMAWSGIKHAPAKQYEDWDDIDESQSSLVTGFDTKESFEEEDEDDGYDMTQIDIDGDIGEVKEAAG